MKLKQIKHDHNYQFFLTCTNQEMAKVDLEQLIAKYVNSEEIKTARVNQEWGCLEFKNGAFDIKPKTLDKFCHQSHS